METLELQWRGPFRFVGIGSDVIFNRLEAKLGGVYLWTIPLEGQYLTHYVGQTGGFAKRFRESEQWYRGGLQKIYDSGEFAMGILKKPYLMEGYYGRDPKIKSARKVEFTRRAKELEPHLQKMKSLIHFFVAPVEEKRLRERIEAAIYYRLSGSPGKIRLFLEEGVKNYYGMRPERGEVPIIVKMRFPQQIMGLDREMDITV